MQKKNHVKRNTTTQVIAVQIWIEFEFKQIKKHVNFFCALNINRKYMEQVIQHKKNHSIWINGLKDTASGIWIWIWNKFKLKSFQKCEKMILC